MDPLPTEGGSPYLKAQQTLFENGPIRESQRMKATFLLRVYIQSSAKRRRPGLVNFVSAVAYHSCLSLPAAFTQPGRSLLADPCTV